ncbi:MAG: hypothetical protein LBL83_05245 [Clostridiales bacterium]|jgi:hypothetical protein|nr:hypothetical protein [Clostridiales bacterium]
MDLPAFWKSDLGALDGLAGSARVAEVSEIARSAGNRPVWAFRYGARQAVASSANYSSACGAHDSRFYADRQGKKPAVLLVGAVHGQETEGLMALLNLVSLLETGLDLGGRANRGLVEAAGAVRLTIVPAANPDGRARVAPDSMIGMRNDELQYWGQGTWKDGNLCRWPDCKRVHPIKDFAGFLGGYFNDDGVNLNHDQFFKPMARETQALFDIAIDEFADCILMLHGGTNSQNALLPTAYAPLEACEALRQLARRCDTKARAEGLAFCVPPFPPLPSGDTPPSFNLASALHHAVGAVAAIFESNECIVDQPGVQYTHEQIYRSHMILFEEALRFFASRQLGGAHSDFGLY